MSDDAEDKDMEVNEEASSFGLLVKFGDESPSFVHGFEAGQVWERMEQGVSPLELTGHLENKQVFKDIAAVKGYTYRFRKSSVEGWGYFVFKKQPANKPKAKASHLKLVPKE